MGMKFCAKTLLLSLFWATVSMAGRSQDTAWLHAQGTQIQNGLGQEVLLRGMGLGGWMVQEGYMLQTQSFANPQHEIGGLAKDCVCNM